MADNENLAAAYGAEGNGETSFWDAATDFVTKEASDIKESANAALVEGWKGTQAMVSGISDWAEHKFQNEDENAGITDWTAYEEFGKYSPGQTEEQKKAAYKALFEKGVISDEKKFQEFQKRKESEMSQEEKDVAKGLTERRDAFKQKAIEAFRKSGALGYDVSAPDARKMLDGIDEVAADYVGNYAKIVGDDTGYLDKTKWNQRFDEYEADMLASMTQWAEQIRL